MYHGVKYVSYDRIPSRSRLDTVHIFSSSDFGGRLRNTESSSGFYRWIDINKIPFDKMWKDTQRWFNFVLDRQKFPTDFAFFYDGKKTRLIKEFLVTSKDDAKRAFGFA